jgi:hypothetical protein
MLELLPFGSLVSIRSPTGKMWNDVVRTMSPADLAVVRGGRGYDLVMDQSKKTRAEDTMSPWKSFPCARG